MARTLITGAAGNLGSLLARHLLAGGDEPRLMYHRRPLPPDLLASRATAVRADLSRPETLGPALASTDVVVHFAGVLFAPGPERFLPVTNTRWFDNLVSASLTAGVRKLILISFPHVEGPTSPEHPASGRLDGRPISVHARTRLDEERLLFARTRATGTTPVVLRLGMVYGRGILMIDAARWLAARRLLAVWREPTWIQLISAADCMAAIAAAIRGREVAGIYHIGDERPVTLQQFLDEACRAWGYRPPRRLPVWLIEAVAAGCEAFATVAGTASPLTRDFLRIGRVSYCGDTSRMRRELVPQLQYPSLSEGLPTL